MTKDEALKEAIIYCIKNNIMKDFLEEHGSEVVNMLSQEFDIEIAKKVWQEEAEERGIERGVKKGMERAMEKVAEEMIKAGVLTESITKFTGLTAERIENLRKEQADK